MPKQGKDPEQSQNEALSCIMSNFSKPIDKKRVGNGIEKKTKNPECHFFLCFHKISYYHKFSYCQALNYDCYQDYFLDVDTSNH